MALCLQKIRCAGGLARGERSIWDARHFFWACGRENFSKCRGSQEGSDKMPLPSSPLYEMLGALRTAEHAHWQATGLQGYSSRPCTLDFVPTTEALFSLLWGRGLTGYIKAMALTFFWGVVATLTWTQHGLKCLPVFSCMKAHPSAPLNV